MYANVNIDRLNSEGAEVEIELEKMLVELSDGIVNRMAEVAECSYDRMLNGIKNNAELNEFFKKTRSKALELLVEGLKKAA
jgi:hypothetical protein